ncbi:hypothetical protein J7L68_01855 [bacterium]|nr:hypothetical protein [bacterium]
MKKIMKKRNLLTPVLFIFLLVCLSGLYLQGCAATRTSYYDPTTYKNLTYIKPQVLLLYETFTSEEIDTMLIDNIRLKLAQIYEYEKGKDNNSETTRQIQKIQEMFERHVKDRFEKGKWTKEHLENEKENIEEAFDIAIKTERAKNKNE